MNSKTDNVIFLQHPQGSESQNADESTDPAIFYQRPRSTPEEVAELENETLENQSEFDRRHQVAGDIKSMSRTQLKELYPGAYSSWKNIKQRCKRGDGELHPEFDQWPDFLLAVGPRPADGYTVDRIDFDNAEYGPRNCRWAPKSLQTANRRNTRYLTDSQDTRLTVTAWSRRFGVTGKIILQRVDRDGWSVDDAVRPERKAAPTTRATTKKSLFPDAAPAYLQQMLDKWIQGLSKHHDCKVFLLEWKHVKLLEYIHEGLLRCGVPPAHVVEKVVSDWCWFTKYRDAPRHSKPPVMPDFYYMKQNIMPAAHYYLCSGGKRLSEVYPDQVAVPADPGQFDDNL